MDINIGVKKISNGYIVGISRYTLVDDNVSLDERYFASLEEATPSLAEMIKTAFAQAAQVRAQEEAMRGQYVIRQRVEVPTKDYVGY